MNSFNASSSALTTRREFLKTSSKAAAGAALASAITTPAYTAESNTIKVALVGCGGRELGTNLWRSSDRALVATITDPRYEHRYADEPMWIQPQMGQWNNSSSGGLHNPGESLLVAAANQHAHRGLMLIQ